MNDRMQRKFLDWSLPSSRENLRVGDILETYDCGYIAVKDIKPEGVIQGNTAAIFPDHFWTWEKLNFYGCCIIYEDKILQDFANRIED